MIYPADAKGPYKVPGVHDPQSKRFVGVMYRPPVWTANTVYYYRGEDDYDVVIPTVFNGFLYNVINPGKSAATEPVWPTTVDETVTCGSVIFKAAAYNLMPDAENIVTSTWVATDSVTLINPSSTATSAQVMISAVPTGVEAFTLTNHTVRSNDEEQDVSLYFTVGNR
jgi:hypothetical protein